MKKVFGAFWREAENPSFQQRAIKQFDKISSGDKVIAPKHPTDQRVFKEAIQNKKIKEEVNRKHDKLIEQVNQINIKSTDPHRTNLPAEREPIRHVDPTEKDFPKFEYGFYELPAEKLSKNRLSFREALEILRARLDSQINAEGKIDAEVASSSAELLKNHPAVKRVDSKKLENMWRYFRPYVRRDKQRVVLNRYLDDVRDVMSGKPDPMEILGNPVHLLKEMLVHKKLRKNSVEEERFDFMEEEEQQKFVEGMRARQIEEFLRLEKRLTELHQLDDEIQRERKEKEMKDDDKKKIV